jgi:hypothetical protein
MCGILVSPLSQHVKEGPVPRMWLSDATRDALLSEFKAGDAGLFAVDHAETGELRLWFDEGVYEFAADLLRENVLLNRGRAERLRKAAEYYAGEYDGVLEKGDTDLLPG